MRAARGIFVAVALSMLSSHPTVAQQASPDMTFFVTSVGSGRGGDLGGLEGADKHCQNLAEAAGVKGRTWRAYLSSQGLLSINASDRVAPKGAWVLHNWRNAKGVLVARNLEELQGKESKLTKDTNLTEKGQPVQRHDILTGSQPDGKAYQVNEDMTCQSWTSSTTGSAQLGHADRQGGGANGTSWNSAHPSKGCSVEALRSTGGDGQFYCFSIEVPKGPQF